MWIESPWGKVRETVDLYYGIAPGTINAEHQWWYPELNQAGGGFELSCINCIDRPQGPGQVQRFRQRAHLPGQDLQGDA